MGLLKVQLGVFGKRIEIDEETKEETIWWDGNEKYCYDITISTEPSTRAGVILDILNFKHEDMRNLILVEGLKQFREGFVHDSSFLIHIKIFDASTKHIYADMHMDVKITDDIHLIRSNM